MRTNKLQSFPSTENSTTENSTNNIYLDLFQHFKNARTFLLCAGTIASIALSIGWYKAQFSDLEKSVSTLEQGIDKKFTALETKLDHVNDQLVSVKENVSALCASSKGAKYCSAR